MSDLNKLPWYVRVAFAVIFLGAFVGVWAFGLNQFASFTEKVHAAEERTTLAECVSYGAPHAVVADGKAYCYTIYYGSEQMIPLETLRKMYKPTTEQQ